LVKAVHVHSVPVIEMFGSLVAWEGVVEVFSISDHPKAKRCYARSHLDKGETQFTTVLEIPPVVSPETAVKAAIASRAGFGQYCRLMAILATESVSAANTVIEAIKLITALVLLLAAIIPVVRENRRRAKKKAEVQTASRGRYSQLMLALWFACMVGSGLSAFWSIGTAAVLVMFAFVTYSASFKFDHRPMTRAQVANLVGIAVLALVIGLMAIISQLIEILKKSVAAN
jgi:hypothetical protein